MKHRIDQMSKRILAQIGRDAGCDVEAIAQAVGCSVEVAADRIRKLQEDGVVRGFRAHVDMARVGSYHEALVVGVPSHTTDPATLQALAQEEDVDRVFTMAAQASIAFHVHGQDADSIETRATELAKRIGLQAFRTTMVVNHLEGEVPEAPLQIDA